MHIRRPLCHFTFACPYFGVDPGIFVLQRTVARLCQSHLYRLCSELTKRFVTAKLGALFNTAPKRLVSQKIRDGVDI
jgi:hypothetical protein